MKLISAMKLIAGAVLSVGLLHTSALAAPVETEKQAGAQGGNPISAASMSVLQVTGTSNSFTVSAQHADVLSLLKLVFDQAHRQFVPDASVTGDVTFALSGQKFDVVVAAICKQTFLRYEVDSHGIYQFRRDEEALRSLLLKTQAVNGVLSEQLRRMGYAVPNDLIGPDNVTRNRMARGMQGAQDKSANGGFGGSFGGGLGGGGGANFQDARGRGGKDASVNAPAPAPKSQVPELGRRADNNKAESERNSDTRAGAARQPENRSGRDGTQQGLGVDGTRGETGPTGPAGQALPQADGAGKSYGRSRQQNAPGANPAEEDIDNAGQQLFMKQNNLVSINTKNQRVPMQEILADLSKQAGVPILVDPDVPKGNDFVLSATIPARPLNEMLNILGYYARLEWRWVNGRIYITTTPQLQLYLRGALLPNPGNGGNIGSGITILPQRLATPQNQAPPKKTEDAEKGKKDKEN